MRKAIWSTTALTLAILVLALAVVAGRQSAEAGSDIVVNTAADHTPDGCSPADCTLREALLAVTAGQSVGFDIDGAGPHVITLSSALGNLPTIGANGIQINGYTQDGAQANTAASFQPGNAVIKIVLDGQLLTTQEWGLWVGGDNVVIQGLSFVNFGEMGIKVGTLAGSALIQGNYVGVYADGETPGPNGVGIWVRSSQAGNLIGGSQAGQRNVVSGNTTDGLWITGGTAVVITGNYIGTDDSGSKAVPNGGAGISMAGGSHSTIGGNNGSAPGNLVSGNLGAGISLSTAQADHMNIKGNRIGVAADGVTAMGNGGDGVLLDQGAFFNTIGGEFVAGEQNIIAYNGGSGVTLTASAGVDNYIDPNLTYKNAKLGADLLDDDIPLPNDNGDGTCDVVTNPTHCPDADGGNTPPSDPDYANRLMNYPIISAAGYDGTTLTIVGSITTEQNAGYQNLFFFWNEECDPSGYGEAKYFMGSLGAPIGPTGVYNFSQTIPIDLSGTIYLVMQASDPEASSEYSPCYELDTGIPATSKWGDSNCNGTIDTGEASSILRYSAGMSVTPVADCPTVGSLVTVNGVSRLWGDNNCSNAVDPVDALLNLAYATLLTPSPIDQCPLVGEAVNVE